MHHHIIKRRPFCQWHRNFIFSKFYNFLSFDILSEEISNYGQNYARIIRERWNFAECGEDFLILVIQRRPRSLSRNSEGIITDLRRPLLFLSYGSIIHEKLTSMEAFSSHSHLHRGGNGDTSIHTVVEDENSHLQNGYPLNRVSLRRILPH